MGADFRDLSPTGLPLSCRPKIKRNSNTTNVLCYSGRPRSSLPSMCGIAEVTVTVLPLHPKDAATYQTRECWPKKHPAAERRDRSR
jgi:hypothetical protein